MRAAVVDDGDAVDPEAGAVVRGRREGVRPVRGDVDAAGEAGGETVREAGGVQPRPRAFRDGIVDIGNDEEGVRDESREIRDVGERGVHEVEIPGEQPGDGGRRDARRHRECRCRDKFPQREAKFTVYATTPNPLRKKRTSYHAPAVLARIIRNPCLANCPVSMREYGALQGKGFMLKRFLIFAGILSGWLSPFFAGGDGVAISWGAPSVLGKGDCGRVCRLNDGRFMAVYREGGGVCRFSGDVCRTWSPTRRILPDFTDPERGRVRVENPACAQLPGDHPRRSGRLLYAVDLCLESRRPERLQHAVALVVSDDEGKTWSEMKVLTRYSAEGLPADTQRCDSRGPFVLPLPNGAVWIYFVDGRQGRRTQRNSWVLAALESQDGGDTWSAPRALETGTGEVDGTPVALVQGDTVYLALALNPDGTSLRPQLAQSPSGKAAGGTFRDGAGKWYDPREVISGNRKRCASAPCLSATETCYLMCWQTSDNPAAFPQTAEVVAMRKTETAYGRLSSFRGVSRPYAGTSALRNSLCPLGGDDFLLVSSVGGEIQTLRGKIRCGDPRPSGGRAVMAWRKGMPDPTTWRADGVWYASSSAQQVLTSDDFFSWRETGHRLLEDAEYRYWQKRGYTKFWAPDVTEVNGRTTLYITCYRTREDCQIVAYTASAPGGPFTGRHVVTSSLETGICDTIDPEVVSDPETGRRWLFFGSVDGIHRVELSEDGLSVRPGAAYTRVAGLTDRQDPSRLRVFEGAYLYRREGWWYLFASRGFYADRNYAIVVGRSRSLEGVFADKAGAPMREGNATPLLESASDPRFYGPGHNGEIRTLDGHDYLVYHCHVRDFHNAARTMFIRELFWDADGWPFVKP